MDARAAESMAPRLKKTRRLMGWSRGIAR
jgi:hypothetical protein